VFTLYVAISFPPRQSAQVEAMARSQRRQTFLDTDVHGALARRVIFHWLFFLCVRGGLPLLVIVAVRLWDADAEDGLASSAVD
jgi:hypothetical protein